MHPKSHRTIIEQEMENLFDEHEFYNFPKFLKKVRDIHMLSRETASDLLGWPTHELANMERGLVKNPCPRKINDFCYIFAIPRKIMQIKIAVWLEEWGKI